MPIIDTLITDRTAGACYNASDLNRVGHNVTYLAGLLGGYGYAVTVTGRTDWAVGEIPSKADMDAYLADVAALRGAVAVMSTTPEVPESMSRLKWDEANDIEQILRDVDELIIKMAAAWVYCGEIYGGEI